MSDNPHLNDRELMALASEIDRLAFEDRGDEGLEARVYAATLPVLQGAAHPPLRLVPAEPAGSPVYAVARSRAALRIAAGFAIAATAALTWIGTHRVAPAPVRGGAVAAAGVSSGVDEWAIAEELDDGIVDELHLLANQATAVRDNIEAIGTGDHYEEAM